MIYDLKLIDGTRDGKVVEFDWPDGTEATGYAASLAYESGNPDATVRAWRPKCPRPGQSFVKPGNWIAT